MKTKPKHCSNKQPTVNTQGVVSDVLTPSKDSVDATPTRTMFDHIRDSHLPPPRTERDLAWMLQHHAHSHHWHICDPCADRLKDKDQDTDA